MWWKLWCKQQEKIDKEIIYRGWHLFTVLLISHKYNEFWGEIDFIWKYISGATDTI